MNDSIRKQIESSNGKPLKSILVDLYWSEQMSTVAIAEQLGVSPSAVRKWMIALSIPRRQGSSVQKVTNSTGRRPKSQRPDQRGAANPNWKGGRVRHPKGYVLAYAPNHPDAVGGYVLEHRLVAESMLGRRLTSSEDVHHKDGDKSNNHPDNLEILAHAEHARLEAGKRVARLARSLAGDMATAWPGEPLPIASAANA